MTAGPSIETYYIELPTFFRIGFSSVIIFKSKVHNTVYLITPSKVSVSSTISHSPYNPPFENQVPSTPSIFFTIKLLLYLSLNCEKNEDKTH